MRLASFEPIASHNPFLMSADPERRLAHRAELKRKLAELQVKKTRLDEIDTIVAKLQADADKAAVEHGEAASKLQLELDDLDSQHTDAILRGDAPSKKLLDRRGQILEELAELNQQLEIRCEANRRSIQSVRNQAEGLRTDVGQIEVTRHQLRGLCSPETRQQILAVDFLVQGIQSAIADARRREGIQRENTRIHKLNKVEGGRDAVITAVRLADLEAAVRILNEPLTTAMDNQRRLQDLALNE